MGLDVIGGRGKFRIRFGFQSRQLGRYGDAVLTTSHSAPSRASRDLSQFPMSCFCALFERGF